MTNIMTFSPLQNKYTRWYFSIISNRQTKPVDGYIEQHHIQPKSLGGTNAKDNLVRLTAREHYICHWLLTKMLTGEAKRSMHFAFYSMQRKKSSMERYVPNSHIYAIARKSIDRTPSAETRKRMSESQKLRAPATEEHRANLSSSVKASYTAELREHRSKQFKGRVVSKETRAKQSQARTGMKRSEASRKKQGASNSGENHWRAKEWVLLSPAGEIYRTRAIAQFCAERSIAHGALNNRARFKDLRPISRGPSIGWSVLSSH